MNREGGDFSDDEKRREGLKPVAWRVVPEPRDAEEGIARERMGLVKASEGVSRLGTGKFYT